MKFSFFPWGLVTLGVTGVRGVGREYERFGGIGNSMGVLREE